MKRTPTDRVDLLWLFERLVKGPAEAGEEYVTVPTDLALYILELAKLAPWPRGPHPKSRVQRNRENLVIMRAKLRKRELKRLGLSAGEALPQAAGEASKTEAAKRARLSAATIQDRMQRKARSRR